MREVYCVIQARQQSTRLPGKMTLPFGGSTLIERAVRQANAIFSPERVIVALPTEDGADVLRMRIAAAGGCVFTWGGEASDVLSRFYFAARTFMPAADDLIVRWTPDDWRKSTKAVRLAVAGFANDYSVQESVELSTFRALDGSHWTEDEHREHIGLLYGMRPEPPDDGLPWSIDTQADYDAAVQAIAEGRAK